ncbi:hypothetical protein GCM10011571_00110 [Marinithermofilum abyssi]|uniref:Uncharacterized protein n=1 Tax=Marinithermofilum abyssi TaxID=1571185 RepID=A0A8J2VBF3_9BACL|nr:hypothetical protein [Marinithermofilum abyssi]GGE03273.1 hypothetical protein GCM10011571_00110 [Marinithermofilum abyssi]
MIHRIVGWWLTLILGLPMAAALVYVAAYQGLLDSKEFYPFWLGEVFFYMALPMVALTAVRIHWGKRNPIAYWLLSVVLIGAMGFMGWQNWKKNIGVVDKVTLYPMGVAGTELLTQEKTTYRIPYYPLNTERVLETIRTGKGVEVYRVRDKPIILAFRDPAFSGYTPEQRLINLAIGLLAALVFAVFFWIVAGVWWKSVSVGEREIVLRNWGRRTYIPLADVIHVWIRKDEEEIWVETDPAAWVFPYDADTSRLMAAVAEREGLDELKPKERWVRRVKWDEVRLYENHLRLIRGEQERRLSYGEIEEIHWDGLLHILLRDEEEDILITDDRYTDWMWFDELAALVSAVWEQEGKGYMKEVDPESGSISFAVTLLEEGGGGHSLGRRL